MITEIIYVTIVSKYSDKEIICHNNTPSIQVRVRKCRRLTITPSLSRDTAELASCRFLLSWSV